jgi:hypothetical protein
MIKQFQLECSIERKMTLESGKVIHEIITADEVNKAVIFKIHPSDPVMRGSVINMVFEDGGEVFLEYTMNWTYKKDKPEGPDMPAQEMIEKAVMQAIEIAEAA